MQKTKAATTYFLLFLSTAGFLCSFLTTSCVTVRKNQTGVIPSYEMPFRYLDDKYMIVSVKVNQSIYQDFIFDTGAGMNLISRSLCRQIKCVAHGKQTGKQMSGRDLALTMTRVGSLTVGNSTQKSAPAGVFDLEAMIPKTKLGGFLSLQFFKNIPFTIDYRRQTIAFDSPESLAEAHAEGTVVPIRVEDKDGTIGISMPLVLPNGQQINVAVDTGSQSLVLHKKFLEAMGVPPVDPKAKPAKGAGDEPARVVTVLHGDISLAGAPSMKAENPDVTFQNTIYDGIVGHPFLSRFRVTFDLAHSEMIFRKPVIPLGTPQ